MASSSSSSSSSSATPATATAASRKYDKNEWFSVYIRGVRDIGEGELKDFITKRFGELKFYKKNQNIALCDFVLKEAQKKALDAREVPFGDVKIKIEKKYKKKI